MTKLLLQIAAIICLSSFCSNFVLAEEIRVEIAKYEIRRQEIYGNGPISRARRTDTYLPPHIFDRKIGYNLFNSKRENEATIYGYRTGKIGETISLTVHGGPYSHSSVGTSASIEINSGNQLAIQHLFKVLSHMTGPRTETSPVISIAVFSERPADILINVPEKFVEAPKKPVPIVQNVSPGRITRLWNCIRALL